MAKKITRTMKIMAMGGEASPAKLGQKLGPYGIGAKFCMEFNAKTADRKGELVPCFLTIYEDKTFDLVLKTSPVTFLLKKAAGIKSGSSKGEVVATLSKDKLKEIAETKLPDLNAYTVEEAMKIVEGTARNMGIKIAE